MKNKIFTYIALCLLLTVATAMLGACEDWNEPRPLEFETIGPDAQQPDLYARYTQSLREYKKQPHYIVYARLDNAPDVSTSEKDFLRAMPDSLDFVAMARSAQLTAFDREDMRRVQTEKGTRILWYADLNEGNTAVDKAIAGMTSEGFDGISLAFAGAEVPDPDIIEKLTAVAGPRSNIGKVLLFEGNPAVLPEALREAFDYIVLSTSKLTTAYDLKFQIEYARQFAGIPAAKIIITAAPGGKLNDIGMESIIGTAQCVISTGPVAGLGIYQAGNDYYDPLTNYKTIREAIRLLNPSPLN